MAYDSRVLLRAGRQQDLAARLSYLHLIRGRERDMDRTARCAALRRAPQLRRGRRSRAAANASLVSKAALVSPNHPDPTNSTNPTTIPLPAPLLVDYHGAMTAAF